MKVRKGGFVPEGESREEITLWSKYDMPLLKVLIDLGGESKIEEIKERVVREMRTRLKNVDYMRVSSGEETTAKNNIGWASDRLKKGGFLDKSTPHIWRITAKGREYYNDKMEKIF